jgi:5'-3' exoribonuclease 1
MMRQTKDAQFQLLHLSVLREYIEIDFGLGIEILDRERLIDDFVFLTFLVGNDFLPHLPTLDISEHAFDVIFDAYRIVLAEKPDDKYIVKSGEISDISQLEKLFTIIGSKELTILSEREVENKAFKRRKFGPQVEGTDAAVDNEEGLQKAFDDAFNEMLALDKDIASDNEVDSNEQTAKDYRGRYYFDKFKVFPKSSEFSVFMNDLRKAYLEGLKWCLAYYVKGCVSWTWFYPYHYGPMLQDMRQLAEVSQRISFTLGEPFRPFQQLLGCLPPASAPLVPKSYAWLMTNKESPLIHFYPNSFEVDADGKKSPWEAVVKLPFIDETALIEAEALHCSPSQLTLDDRKRNAFGKILMHVFDPTVAATYFSCNPEIGLPDVTRCQTSVTEVEMNIVPGNFFQPSLVAGTTCPFAGFPCLGVIDFARVQTDFIKVNIFGRDTKYRSVVLELQTLAVELDAIAAIVSKLLGSSVFVNYPLIHEAKVVAVSDCTDEYRIGANGEIIRKPHDVVTANKWARDSVSEVF